jgi:hypothetical protein
VIVVAHHRVACHVDREHRGELLDALGHPGAAMRKALARVAVLAAEIGAAHAARDAVIPGGVVDGDECGAGAGHGCALLVLELQKTLLGEWLAVKTKWVSLCSFVLSDRDTNIANIGISDVLQIDVP